MADPKPSTPPPPPPPPRETDTSSFVKADVIKPATPKP